MTDDMTPEATPDVTPEAASPAPAPMVAAHKSRKPVFIAVGIVLAVVLAGAGVGGWALMRFLSSGPSAAETLPDSTVAFVSLTLDPGGSQKIEAFKTLKKFPAWDDHLGLDSNDDIIKAVFDYAMEQDPCANLDYSQIDSWLGDRFAVAAIDDGDAVQPIVVVESKNDDAAAKGIEALDNCDANGDATVAAGGSDRTAYALNDGWVILGEDQDTVDGVVSGAKKASLADDAGYQKWTSEAGSEGVLSFYLSPEAPTRLAEVLRGQSLDGLSADEFDSNISQGLEALKDFEGAAGTLRFNDGGVEMEFAGGLGTKFSQGSVGDLVSKLPATTALALAGAADPELLRQQLKDSGLDTPQTQQMTQGMGIDLPNDLVTVFGRPWALVVDKAISVGTMESPTDLPVGIAAGGDDLVKLSDVVDSLNTALSWLGVKLEYANNGERMGISLNSDYADTLSKAGKLGDEQAFKDVIPHTDNLISMLYLNADIVPWDDAKDLGLSQDDQEIIDNVKVLSAIGISGWLDGDITRVLVRIGTD